jgi:1-acyl-sn-glycerol-3-phosphate acyltransferase
MKWMSRKILGLMGWTFEGTVPDVPKMIVVGFPHTSNWDLFVYFAVMDHFGVQSRFLIKKGVFKGPLGWMLRRWGGIPVDRSVGADIVGTAVAAFASHDELVLVIAPEGTRAQTEVWKSGFWRIADEADVPVVMAFVDGETKTAGFGPAVKVDGDPAAWIAQASAFYDRINGLKAENRSNVAL